MVTRETNGREVSPGIGNHVTIFQKIADGLVGCARVEKTGIHGRHGIATNRHGAGALKGLSLLEYRDEFDVGIGDVNLDDVDAPPGTGVGGRAIRDAR
jgi:hypothetical protein